MMGVFQDKWTVLVLHRYPTDHSHRGSRVIIDNILLWSTVIDTLLNYFQCVCDVFLKYRITVQLKKCEFITNRIEYVGHDITPHGNYPAESKFDLVADWPIPATGISLLSLIGLLTYTIFTALGLRSASNPCVCWSVPTTASQSHPPSGPHLSQTCGIR
jgi:hypothetical protein